MLESIENNTNLPLKSFFNERKKPRDDRKRIVLSLISRNSVLQ